MKKIFGKMDIWLLILMLVFSIFGLIMIFSASSVSTVLRYNVPQYHFFLRQAIFLISSFIAGFLIVIRFPTSKYKYLTPLAILAIIVALIGLLVYGKLTNNVRSWYDLGFFALQPSEFAKVISIIWMANYYEDKKDKLASYWYSLFPIFVCGLVSLLIFAQPDLGTGKSRKIGNKQRRKSLRRVFVHQSAHGKHRQKNHWYNNRKLRGFGKRFCAAAQTKIHKQPRQGYACRNQKGKSAYNAVLSSTKHTVKEQSAYLSVR